MKKPLLPWGFPPPGKVAKAAPPPCKVAKAAPSPAVEKASRAVKAVKGRLPPAPAPKKAVEGRDYGLLDCPPVSPPAPRRTASGQDLPLAIPLVAPTLRVKVGELSGKRLVSYDGDDVWYCEEQGGVSEARRCWIVKYGIYFPEAARLLRIEAKEVESLLS